MITGIVCNVRFEPAHFKQVHVLPHATYFSYLDLSVYTLLVPDRQIRDIMHYLQVGFGLLFLNSIALGFGRSANDSLRVDVKSTLKALMQDEDTDNDTRITIDDPRIDGTDRGDKRFWIGTKHGRFEIAGTYYLSNLLQELKFAEDAGQDSVTLQTKRIFEPPLDHLSRMIREHYWDGLTRRIDAHSLLQIVKDEKTTTIDGYHYVYVPSTDHAAYNYYERIAEQNPDATIKVVRLPHRIDGTYVRDLDGHHGILSLALVTAKDRSVSSAPFVVPGGRFNEMYGWDSYFITLGLLQDGRIDLAKSMVDDFVYEINEYGKILNANRSYYLTRSQPPFFTSMLLAVYEKLPKNDDTKDWLRRGLDAAIHEYRTVWMGPDHLTKTGLSRYYDTGYGPPPEVELGAFDNVYAKYAKKYGMDIKAFEEAYRSGKLKVPELDEYFKQDRAMRESGHDTSYRLEGRCANLVTVDLNSLLYKIETDIAGVIEKDFGGAFKTESGALEHSRTWSNYAMKRKDLVDKYLWNESRGMFFDYDFTKNEQTGYVSATMFYPLWAGLASREQSRLSVERALPLLEMPGGIAGSTEESRGPITPTHPLRQWDYPYGWAPHQILIWKGLQNYGYTRDAERLAYEWLFTIVSNAADFNGTVPEKFNVVTRSHEVFAEYGNVGTKFSYITREGFGWTNASVELGSALLSKELRDGLNRLIPPEWVF